MKHTNNKREGTNNYAGNMLLSSKRCTSDWFTTISNHKDLNSNGQKGNKEEEPVVEESLEYVEVKFAEFSWVNLVEDLHEYEGIEEDCELG